MEKGKVNPESTPNILISGGLGFIGSSLALQLEKEKHSTVLVDSLNAAYGGNLQNIQQRTSEEFLKINISDVRDKFSLKYLLKNTSLIYNLAGQTSHMDSMTDPFTDLDINARHNYHCLKFAEKWHQVFNCICVYTTDLWSPKLLTCR